MTNGLISAFLDVRQNWHPGEIQTLTGFDESEFEALQHNDADWSTGDIVMLRQAANTLLGLPTTSDEACVEFLGMDWVGDLKAFLEETGEND